MEFHHYYKFFNTRNISSKPNLINSFIFLLPILIVVLKSFRKTLREIAVLKLLIAYFQQRTSSKKYLDIDCMI